jgi:hypothetical protein
MGPTLAQLRERLRKIQGTHYGMRLVNETETVQDFLARTIAEREERFGLRNPPTGNTEWGRL